MVDLSEGHEYGHGFDPSVCEGCPHRQTDTMGSPCGLCGCPTVPRAPMDLLDAPPESCPRLDDHEDNGGWLL